MMKANTQRQQMADAVRQCKERILIAWEIAVRTKMPVNRPLGRSPLRNSLSLLLEGLATALEDENWNYHTAANTQIACEHARQRADLGLHHVGEVIDEYSELRRSIVRNLEHFATAEATEAWEVIHQFIDASSKQASSLFSELSAEQEQRMLNDALRQARSEKTSLEEERDLCSAYTQELEEERRMRSQVVAMLGHDMRSPLAAALLTAQQLVRKIDGVPMGPQRLGRVIRAIERISSMVQSFLDADQLRAAQHYPLRIVMCDLREVFENALHTLEASYGERFVLDVPDGLVACADRDALERVLENLGSNAVKYGGTDLPIILRLEKVDTDVVLSVYNEGDPIDPQLQMRLFEPHFRIDASRRSPRDGWGLGLASAKAIAEAHGGDIGVHSTAEDGTSFRIQFPLRSL